MNKYYIFLIVALIYNYFAFSENFITIISPVNGSILKDQCEKNPILLKNLCLLPSTILGISSFPISQLKFELINSFGVILINKFISTDSRGNFNSKFDFAISRSSLSDNFTIKISTPDRSVSSEIHVTVICTSCKPCDPPNDALTLALLQKYRFSNQPINQRSGCC